MDSELELLKEENDRLKAESTKLKKHLAVIEGIRTSKDTGGSETQHNINLRESMIETWMGTGLTRKQAIIAARGRDGLQEADETAKDAHSTVGDIASYFKRLKTCKFPAIKQEIYDFAETNKAPDDILRALGKLPEKVYEGIDDILMAIQL